MAAVVSVVCAQMTHQNVTSAEHLQLKARMLMVGGEKLAGLVSMNRNVGALKIQHDFSGRSFVLLNEVMPQQFLGVEHCLQVHALLHPAQGRFARQNGLYTGRGLAWLVSARQHVTV